MRKTYEVVPHPKLKREYEGRRVRTTRELRNGWNVTPKGALATIDYQSPKGSTLLFDPCECCGVRAIISAVDKESIEFIKEQDNGTN